MKGGRLATNSGLVRLHNDSAKEPGPLEPTITKKSLMRLSNLAFESVDQHLDRIKEQKQPPLSIEAIAHWSGSTSLIPTRAKPLSMAADQVVRLSMIKTAQQSPVRQLATANDTNADTVESHKTKRDSIDVTMRQALSLCRPTNSQEEMQRSPLKEDFFQIMKLNRLTEIGNARNLGDIVARDQNWLRQRSSIPAYSHVNKGKAPSKHTTNSIFKQFEESKFQKLNQKIEQQRKLFIQTTNILSKVDQQQEGSYQNATAEGGSLQGAQKQGGGGQNVDASLRPSLEHSVRGGSHEFNSPQIKVGSDAIRATGGSQGSVTSNMSYESGGSQDVVMGRRKFTVQTTQRHPKIIKDLDQINETVDGQKNSFDMGCTESLEKGSLSITRANEQAKMKIAELPQVTNVHVQERAAAATDGKRETDDISQDNPLAGYISFEHSPSKDQLQTQTSKEITLNPTLHSQAMNSSEPSNRQIPKAIEVVQRSHEIHEVTLQKVNPNIIDEQRLGALSANAKERESVLQRKSWLKDKTDQTERTFAKEASFDGQVEFSNYSTKKNSDENLKVLSPQLNSTPEAQHHPRKPDDKQGQYYQRNLMNKTSSLGRKGNKYYRSKNRHSELRQGGADASGQKNPSSLRQRLEAEKEQVNKFVNLPVKQMELSEHQFVSRMETHGLLLKSQEQARRQRSGLSSKINNNNLNNQRVVINLQKAKKLINVNQSKLQGYTYPLPMQTSTRTPVHQQAQQPSTRVLAHQVTGSQQKMSDRVILLNDSAARVHVLGKTEPSLVHPGLTQPTSSLGSINAQLPSARQKHAVHSSTSQGRSTPNALDGVFNVQKLQPIVVTTHPLQSGNYHSFQHKRDHNNNRKLPEIRASRGGPQYHIVDSERAKRSSFNAQQPISINVNGVNNGNVDMANTPITRFCDMYIQKNSPGQHFENSKDEHRSTISISSLSRNATRRREKRGEVEPPQTIHQQRPPISIEMTKHHETMIKTHQDSSRWVNSPAYFPIMIQSSNVQQQSAQGTSPHDSASQSHYYFMPKPEYMQMQESPSFLAHLQQANLTVAPLPGAKMRDDLAPSAKGRQSTRLPSKSKKSTMNMTQLLSLLNRKIAKEQGSGQFSNQQQHQQSTRNQNFQLKQQSQQIGHDGKGGNRPLDPAHAQFQSLQEAHTSQRGLDNQCESGRVSIHESSVQMNADTKSFFSFNRKLMNLDIYRSKHLSNISSESFSSRREPEPKMSKRPSPITINQTPMSTIFGDDQSSNQGQQQMNRIKLNLPSQKRMSPLVQNRVIVPRIRPPAEAEKSPPILSPTDGKYGNQSTFIGNSIEHSQSSLEAPLNIGIQQIRVIENEFAKTHQQKQARVQRACGKSKLKGGQNNEDLQYIVTERSLKDSREYMSKVAQSIKSNNREASNAEDIQRRIEKLKDKNSSPLKITRLQSGSPAISVLKTNVAPKNVLYVDNTNMLQNSPKLGYSQANNQLEATVLSQIKSMSPRKLEQMERNKMQALVITNHNSKIVYGLPYEEAKNKRNKSSRTINGQQGSKSRQAAQKRVLSITFAVGPHKDKNQAQPSGLGMNVIGKQTDIAKRDSSPISPRQRKHKQYGESARNLAQSPDKLNSIRALSDDSGSQDSKGLYEDSSYMVKTINDSLNPKSNANHNSSQAQPPKADESKPKIVKMTLSPSNAKENVIHTNQWSVGSLKHTITQQSLSPQKQKDSVKVL